MTLRHARALALFVALIAFGLRVVTLDAVRHYNDFGIPHGLGIGIVELLANNSAASLPLLSLPSGIRLLNPAGASYAWAILALFERSAIVATFMSAALSTLAVALVFDIGRRMFSPSVGLVAAAFMATSPWSIYFARGTWIQGQLEFGAVAAMWLVLLALKFVRPKRLLLGFAFTSLMMQTYLVAMALAAQIGLMVCVTLASSAPRRRLTKAALAGLALCAASALVYAIAVARVQPSPNESDVGAWLTSSTTSATAAPASIGDHLDRAGFQKTLQIVSGRDFVLALADRDERAHMTLRAVNDATALAIEIAVGFGALVALARTLRRRGEFAYRTQLAWFTFPMVATFVLMIAFPRLEVARQYMLLSAPAGYLLGGIGVAWVAGALARRPRATAARPALALGFITILALTALADIDASARATFAHPIERDALSGQVLIEHLPIRDQQRLAQLWREKCAELAEPQSEWWTTSVNQTHERVRQGASHATAGFNIWQVRPDGGTCVTRNSEEQQPSFADAFPLVASDGVTVTLFRSMPVVEAAMLGAVQPVSPALKSNIGWTLIALDAPREASVGETIVVTQVWRIDSLPTEPFKPEQYFMFVKLQSQNGGARTVLENAPMIARPLWRVGDYVIGVARIDLPPDLAAGPSTLTISQYDPVRKVNSAYFDLSREGGVIVEVAWPLNVRD